MNRTMGISRLCLTLVLAALASASPGIARASDQSTFDRLIGRNVIPFKPPFAPLKPKGACLCNEAGLVRQPGFLALYAQDGTVYCLVPAFDGTGTLQSFGSCQDFAILGH